MASYSAGSRPTTRQRILDTSLALFNKRGSAHVTTAEIAKAASVAEGNLQYYFPTKADLLSALFVLFEAEVHILVSREIRSDSPLEDFVEHQRSWFRLMWTHQWFYRGTFALFLVAPTLLPRVRDMTVRNRRFVTSVFERMVEQDFLRVSPEELERLLTNIWMVATYWIDHLRFMTGKDELGRDDLEWGYAQVVAIYAPYLTPKGEVLRHIGMAGPIRGSSACATPSMPTILRRSTT